MTAEEIHSIHEDIDYIDKQQRRMAQAVLAYTIAITAAATPGYVGPGLELAREAAKVLHEMGVETPDLRDGMPVEAVVRLMLDKLPGEGES